MNPGPVYAWPMGFWFSLFFVIPLIIIVAYSFMKRDVYGSVIAEFSLKAYKQMFTPAYGIIFLRTLWITALSTFITILIALPCFEIIAAETLRVFPCPDIQITSSVSETAIAPIISPLPSIFPKIFCPPVPRPCFPYERSCRKKHGH